MAGGPKSGASKGGGRNRGAWRSGGSKAEGRNIENVRSFSLSGGLLVEFWWCFRRRETHMCTFGVLGLSCETRAAQHFRVPAFKNTTKIPREDPQRERKRAKMGAGEGKKSEILGGPADGVRGRGPWQGSGRGGSEVGGIVRKNTQKSLTKYTIIVPEK